MAFEANYELTTIPWMWDSRCSRVVKGDKTCEKYPVANMAMSESEKGQMVASFPLAPLSERVFTLSTCFPD